MPDYECLTTQHFAVQPIEIITRFHEDDDNQEFDLSVVDSAYALLTDSQYDEWIEIFKTSEGPSYEGDFTTCLKFKMGNNNFVLVSDNGDDICDGLFQEYCEEKNIPCQFQVDSPLLDKADHNIDWNNEDDWYDVVYTGAVNDYPELIKIFYEIQYGE